MRVYRLEFEQPPSVAAGWLGPHTAQWITAEAEELATFLEAEHRVTRHEPDPLIFERNPGVDRYICGTDSMAALRAWFGDYLPAFQRQGGHIAEYDVPESAIAEHVGTQVVFQQRQGVVVRRVGTPPIGPLIRSTAGRRARRSPQATGSTASLRLSADRPQRGHPDSPSSPDSRRDLRAQAACPSQRSSLTRRQDTPDLLRP